MQPITDVQTRLPETVSVAILLKAMHNSEGSEKEERCSGFDQKDSLISVFERRVSGAEYKT